MFGRSKKEALFFDNLCEEYYEKILRYLFYVHQDHDVARDCVQEVFLTAYAKRSLLVQHPNPGGFLFQTAKNLSKKLKRESFARAINELQDEETLTLLADETAGVEEYLDRQLDETAYIDSVLEQLTEEKRSLYSLYYQQGKTMADIAALYSLEESALRMRYVRLRREIRGIVQDIGEKHFMV